MVCAGKSCRAMATSPKARSRSTRQTSRRPWSASAAARLVASVVLPQPPLAEKTVTRMPAPAASSSGAGAPAWSRRARVRSRERATAAFSPARSRSSTTSRTPARSDSASSDVSIRRRTSTTPNQGRATRIRSARASADPWSMVGPITAKSAAGSASSSRWRASSETTSRESGPSAERRVSAAAASWSTIRVMVRDAGFYAVGRSLEEVPGVHADAGAIGTDLSVRIAK